MLTLTKVYKRAGFTYETAIHFHFLNYIPTISTSTFTLVAPA